MTVSGDVQGGGLAEPVLAQQRLFRALMGALAEPGRVFAVTDLAAAPAPLSGLAGGVALTLLDHTTPYWLDNAAASTAAWLGYHTGAARTDDPASAHFALITAPQTMPPLTAFAQGEAAYPDRSSTLIVQVEALHGGPTFNLTGPGIAATRALAPAPLPDDMAARLQANRARYPLGVDLLFVAARELAALPRSTSVRAGEG